MSADSVRPCTCSPLCRARLRSIQRRKFRHDLIDRRDAFQSRDRMLRLQQGTRWLKPTEPTSRAIGVIGQLAPEERLLHLSAQREALIRSEFVLEIKRLLRDLRVRSHVSTQALVARARDPAGGGHPQALPGVPRGYGQRRAARGRANVRAPGRPRAEGRDTGECPFVSSFAKCVVLCCPVLLKGRRGRGGGGRRR